VTFDPDTVRAIEQAGWQRAAVPIVAILASGTKSSG